MARSVQKYWFEDSDIAPGIRIFCSTRGGGGVGGKNERGMQNFVRRKRKREIFFLCKGKERRQRPERTTRKKVKTDMEQRKSNEERS